MSLIRDIIGDVIADRENIFGDNITLMRTGETFTAEVQPIADTFLNTEMGRDARETVTIHVRNLRVASKILMQDILKIGNDKFKVLRRSNNPISVQVEFGVMKTTEKDQQ